MLMAHANAALDKYRGGVDYEIGAALAVVGLSAERADREIAIRDDMIRARAVRPRGKGARVFVELVTSDGIFRGTNPYRDSGC